MSNSGYQTKRTNEIFYQFKNANRAALDDLKQLDITKGSGIPYNQLMEVTHLFEYYIFLLSRTLSTIGNINLFVFDTNELCSYNFNAQRSKILEGNDIFGPDYSSIVRNMEWYDESRIIRDNTAHFIGGFTALDKDEEGNSKLIYFSFPLLNNVEDEMERIEIDICKAVKTYNDGFNKVLDQIGICYLMRLEPDTIWNLPDHTYQHSTEIILSDLLEGKITLKPI